MARTDPVDGDRGDLDDIRDEAFSYLHVSVKAKNLQLNYSSNKVKEKQSTEHESVILIGDTVEVVCSYDNPERVNPPPNMRILMTGGDSEEEITNTNEMILATVGIENFSSPNNFIGFNRLKATKKIVRGDMNKKFVCECVQRFENKEIFFNSISSEPLNIFQVPTLVEDLVLPQYYMINATNFKTIQILVKFSSIPKPENKDVSWTITEFQTVNSFNNKSDELEKDETYIVHPGTATSHFVTYPVKSLNNEVYETRIEMKNVTFNTTIILEVENPHGKFVKTLPEIIVARTQDISADIQVMSVKGPMFWVIILIAAILVISILMFSLMVCIRRKKKKRDQEKEDEIDNNENVQMEKTVYKKEKIIVDQNDLSFHMSELGESKKLQRINKKQKDFHASLQDLRAYSPRQHAKRKNTHAKIGDRCQTYKLAPELDVSNSNQLRFIEDRFDRYEKSKTRTNKSTESKLNSMKTQTSNTNGDSEQQEEGRGTIPVVVEKQTSSTKRVTFVTDNDDQVNDLDTESPETKSVLRHSGPTNYPVMAPLGENDSFQKTPSRTTSPIHFTGPTEIHVPITMVSK